jgi:RHS repeat-associated protein
MQKASPKLVSPMEFRGNYLLHRAVNLLALTLPLLAHSPASARDKDPASPPVSALAFSPQPTPQEFFKVRVFEEPLVPVGGEPSATENRALAAALQQYSERTSPDDFSALTKFLDQHPQSPWRAALLTDIGLEYFNTAHYSKALEVWTDAFKLSPQATDAKARAIVDRATGELACMYARLGRMPDLQALLASVSARNFVGAATERITSARDALWTMQNRPEVSFRCGPLALHRIRMASHLSGPEDAEIFNSASTQKGFSLTQVAELSRKVGLNYQTAFREQGGEFQVPSVVHWKVCHYAALVRKQGDKYLLQDPTFGNDVWATRQALEAETSGYFLIPSGALSKGWRSVDPDEGSSILGKGVTTGNDPGNTGTGDHKVGGGSCKAMAVHAVHLMLVNLNLSDEPVGYTPPVGPDVRFIVRYNHREAFQPANFNYSNFGSKWTCDWISYLTDNPQNPGADMKYYSRGGGTRSFTGFDAGTQTYAYQQYDQALLKRTSSTSYEMTWRDGTKLVFAQSDGSTGTSRKIFLTQYIDPFGNAVTVHYDGNLRITSLTDAIGQSTTLTYGLADDIYKITKVTDPFGRFAAFEYDFTNRITKITDTMGMTSQFTYEGTGDFINSLITPYGTNVFTRGGTGTTRWLETLYPDGSRDRVEYNQTTNLQPFSLPAAQVPQGMTTFNQWLHARNTYYWSRNACATAYGDYSKARLFHWLHTADGASTAGILESVKQPLEGRVWYSYSGQAAPYYTVGDNNKPTKVGRVLDDGSTQLYSYTYDNFGHVTSEIDPLGRTFNYIYSTNGIDLLEVRQTRAGNNELLAKFTYNAQHRVLTSADASGQATTNTYNARGQLLTVTNPKGETITYTYDPNGYCITVDGRLPGTGDVSTMTYDAFGRTRTLTDRSGFTLTLDYDALDRLTKTTFPDSTFLQRTFDRLDLSVIRDRAGRQTFLEHDNMRQLTKFTDPLNRATRFQWCSCGSPNGLTDPMGRTTTWTRDVQGRLASKQYGDGSKVSYFYENARSRLRQVIDEKQQVTQFTFNRDDSLQSVAYVNTVVPTPAVSYTYDTNYQRVISMTDGFGTTLYSYNPVTAPPSLGAGRLAAEDGPLPNDIITYGYDELGRRVSTAINGVGSLLTYDPAWRVIGETNALGAFAYSYDGNSIRLLSATLPNGQTEERSYGGNLQDRTLQRITHHLAATPVSEFLFGLDILRHRTMTWSQQSGAESPLLYTFGYDDANQLLSATVTNAGTLVSSFAYTYDPDGNRLIEQVGATNYNATYNALNQLSTTTAPGASRTNEWDAEDRLVAINLGNQRTEFAYDGRGRLAVIRKLVNGSEVSYRRFLGCGNKISEERDASGTVTKRFFRRGMRLETGPAAGNYYYTRDHLGSIRELVDGSGNIRARYSYDPFGRRTRVTGDLQADFGFAGMFWSDEANLSLTHFRAYDPELGRWLSRDPLKYAEMKEGPNLYSYVGNQPVNHIDPLGLCTDTLQCTCVRQPQVCAQAGLLAEGVRRGADTLRGIGSVGPEMAEDTIPCLETAAPEVTESNLPEAVGAEIAPLGDRIADLAERFDPALVAEDLEMVTSETGWLTDYMYQLETEFGQIVLELMELGGMTSDQASNLAARLLGFDPRTWIY